MEESKLLDKTNKEENLIQQQSGQQVELHESIQQAELREPIQQVEPQESIQQSGPQESIQQIEPQESIQQIEPQESIQQIELQESILQSEPQESIQQIEPQESIQQIEPQESIQQIEPQESIQQIEPQESIQQIEPQESTLRSEPQELIHQVEPQEQSHPVGLKKQGQLQYAQTMQQGQSQPVQHPADQMKSMSPEEAEFFSGGMDELNVMIEDVTKRDNLVNEVRNIVNEGKKLEKELEEEKKKLAKDINDTVNDEMAKAVAEENRIITEDSSKLKQVKSDRNKAKEQGIKNRIEKETADMVEENRNLHRYVRRTFKENGLPSYCDTKWFYTLYCTQSGIEWLIKIAVFFCGLVLIPGIFCAVVNPWWFLKIILWAVLIVIFIMVYMTVYLLSKDRDSGVLEEMREHRDKIADNEKKIKSVKKRIRLDTDESLYNLGEFDIQIAELENNIDMAAKRKKEKLYDFEQNKKQGIIDEVNENHIPVIEGKQNTISEKLSLYNQKNNELNELQQSIACQYERFLSKPYTNAACLKRMYEIMQSGSASNIGQAFMLVKR